MKRVNESKIEENEVRVSEVGERVDDDGIYRI